MTSANKHMMQMMHSPRGLPPRIFSLLLMPRCKRPHLGIHKLQWRCREKPGYHYYQYNKVVTTVFVKWKIQNSVICGYQIGDRCAIFGAMELQCNVANYTTHYWSEPALLHLLETVGVGWLQDLGLLPPGTNCGDYVWNEKSELRWF